MRYESFVKELPAERTVSFQSAEENEEYLLRLGVNQEMRQLRRGPFRSDLAYRATEHAELYADRYSTASRMYLEPPPGTVGLAWFKSAEDPLLASGVDTANEKLVFIPENNVVGLVVPELGGSECISIPKDRFLNMFAAFCPMCDPLEEVTMFEGNTAELESLSRTILRLLAEPGEELNPEWISNLLAAVFGWVDESTGHSATNHISSQTSFRPIARKTEEYVQEHYRDPIFLEDICRDTGVGLRTLQRCVKKYFNVTVTELVESVRMTSARRDLSRLRPEEASVTRIAFDNGFTHLGRFSMAYRERYGETPSERLAWSEGQKT